MSWIEREPTTKHCPDCGGCAMRWANCQPTGYGCHRCAGTGRVPVPAADCQCCAGTGFVEAGGSAVSCPRCAGQACQPITVPADMGG